jgi:UDP-N-acetylmuramoyl-tripeptide--D-alanyl-D-alanine ligase
MMKDFFRKIVQYYLKALTKIVLWRHRPLIIAVAGTSNKTFTKEMILDHLGRSAEVRGNPKSFNTEIGLPLAVLFLPSGYSSIYKWADVLLTGTCVSIFSRRFPKILVLELGVDRKGDMEYLLSIVKPNMAVITSIDRNFPDNNATLDDIENEFLILANSISPDGLLVLNADDQRVCRLGKNAQSKVVLVGRLAKSSAQINNIQNLESGQIFDLGYNGKIDKIETGRFGQHNIYACAFAKVVAAEIGKLENK